MICLENNSYKRNMRFMKIKDVEKRVGMTQTNIRYYEKSGLLNRTLRNENNYREYTEEDVEQLQRIKVLRLLGVSPADIKLLSVDEASMKEIMIKRIEELEKETKELKDIQKICENIVEKDIDFYSVNESVFSKDKQLWSQRMEELFAKDIVNENITKKQLNLQITTSLLWGYFINVVIALLYGTNLIHYEGPLLEMEGAWRAASFHSIKTSYLFYVFIVILIICGMGIHFTANVKILIVLFNINAIIISPTIIEITKIFGYGGINLLGDFSGKHIAVFWLMVMFYVSVLYIISIKNNRVFEKFRYTLFVVIVFVIVYTSITFALIGKLAVPAAAFAIVLSYISLVWSLAIQDRESYNRYYAVVVSNKIMNVMGSSYGLYNSRNMKER